MTGRLVPVDGRLAAVAGEQRVRKTPCERVEIGEVHPNHDLLHVRSLGAPDRQVPVRQLFPPRDAAETTVQAVYAGVLTRAQAAAGRPHVLLNMVSSTDGAVAVDGLSGGLSGSADKEVFFYLRSIADVIVVGAATAREENYGQPRLSDELRAQRVARGQPELPRIAIVTRSMRIDWSSRLFADPTSPAGLPLVLCPGDVAPDFRAAAEGKAELLAAGAGGVDFAAALSQLRAQGAHVVLCEGGPVINGQLLSAGLVDELCLTVSPVLVGGRGPRVSGWDDPQPAVGLQLLSCCESGGVLMLRYATKPAA
jgi:riboflavin biosynthesis pyrimidine reductase